MSCRARKAKARARRVSDATDTAYSPWTTVYAFAAERMRASAAQGHADAARVGSEHGQLRSPSLQEALSWRDDGGLRETTPEVDAR